MCSQESLLKQDVAMQTAYDAAWRTSVDKQALAADQRHWLSARDDGVLDAHAHPGQQRGRIPRGGL
jgi:uncharacterized protein YecT (DUF1311 family)